MYKRQGQRTAQFRPIALDHRRRTATRHLAIAQKAAGAGIARGQQLKARREGKGPVDAYDPHVAAFDGLTQRLQHTRGKLSKLVQKEHAAMSQANFARMYWTSAADEARCRNAVMGASKRPMPRKQSIDVLAQDRICLLYTSRR